MPDIELVDLKDKHKRKLMKGHFSDRLIDRNVRNIKRRESNNTVSK